MARSDFALITVRKDRGSVPWTHFGASRHVIDNCFLSSRSVMPRARVSDP